MKAIQPKLLEVAPIHYETTTNPDADLIDCILGTTGKGDELLTKWGSFASLAQNLDAANLTERQRGRLRAALRLNFVRDTPKNISSPSDVYGLLKDLQQEAQEHFVVIVLDRRNNVIHRDNLYIGCVNACTIRIAEVFRQAVIRNACAIVIAHNHPSGDPTPSPDDVAVTRTIVQAGKLLEIDVLDHIVVGHERFTSLKERGLGFN